MAAEPTQRWFWATRLQGSAYHCLTANRPQCQLRISRQLVQQGTANNRDDPVYNMCRSHTWLIIQLVLSWQGGEVLGTEGKGTSILHEGGWEAVGEHVPPYPFCFRAPVKNGTSGVIFRQESRIVPGWASCNPGAGEASLGKQQMLLRLCYPCRGVTSTQDTGNMCLEFPRPTALHKSAPGESSRLCRKLI